MRTPARRSATAALALCLACGGSELEGVEIEASESQDQVLSNLDDLPSEIALLLAPWTGDLDGMVERRLIRILTVHNPMLYSLDGPRQRGLVYEIATAFERHVNERSQTGRREIQVILIPLRRDQLIPALVQGRGDIAAANLTVTPERLEQVDFSEPLRRNVSEVLVSGPSAPTLSSLEALSGRSLRLRRSSSYWSSAERLNASLRRTEREPVALLPANPLLEDHDLLELVHAGSLDFTVVDSHKAA
ncbi:MAG: transporter substrate-binding domain-containing protein, partial [Proteobacteria bacterium]|nr:transporter substrate-binding domain-containing protein [Pseudomonadota bacterium]